MALMYAFLIIIIILGSLGIVYVNAFNKLQDCKIKMDEAESIVDESLRKKYDLLIEEKDFLINNIKDKKISFKDLDELKKDELSNYDLDRRLVDIINYMNKIVDDYPELKKDKKLNGIINETKRADEKITAAKHFYNKYTSLSNELVRKFPSNIVAKTHDIKLKEFFDGKDMNDEITNDFKL